MGLFFAGALVWSIRRILYGGKRWRRVHGANVALMVIAGISIYAGQPALSMIAGIGITFISLAIMTLEKARNRWIGFILLVGGIILASGLPFVTS